MIGGDVLVVGGGPAGLTTALACARRGHEVTLVESSDRLGGMAAGLRVAGQSVDLGSHRLHPSAPPQVRRLLDELLGDDLQVRERNGRLRLADRWVRFPFRPADLARSVPPGVAARLALDLARARDADGARTYADVVRSGLGPTALSSFHGPMARKLWGLPAEDLDADLARRRIGVRDRRTVARRLARTARPGGRTFLYPRLGYGQVVDRLADACADAGVTVATATSVRSLRAGRGSVSVRIDDHADHRADDRDDDRQVSTGRVFWTAPAAALARATGDPPPSITHRGVVLVYLAIERDRWTGFDAHYVPDPDVPFARLSEPKNYRSGPDPAGRTVLCAEIPATPGDAPWQADDDTLASQVLEGIARCGLGAIAPVEVASARLRTVYPVLRPGDATERHAVGAWTERLDGVTLLGRQGLLVADNLHHVLDMALTAAGCLDPSGAWDAAGWRDARLRFDSFVVDD